ncbi:hypothetical protein SAY87_025621 [Trapa incisa]|uniref:Methyl-CpG-binding domain-containing protein 2 n=1 Tax=Trapa incisa TaxID=236973 RepID=A0AAN7GQT4_9MYRT|nr:hypothetical protein SAY87_025621 [Trapa incisa]
MQSPSGKTNLKLVQFKKNENEPESILPNSLDNHNQEPIDSSASIMEGETCEKKEGCDDSDTPLKQLVDDQSCKKTSEPTDRESGDKTLERSIDDESEIKNLKKSLNGESEKRSLIQSADEPNYDHSKQMVIYDHLTNGGGPIMPALDSRDSLHSPFVSHCFDQPAKVLPSVGAFTVQCAACFKWRLIPSKEKYEEIREKILEIPFFCETARQWRPDISCDEPEDISPDDSRLWAIDKPNIPQPPTGWQRLLRIRGKGGTKFADVYYVAPSGKRLRSMVEIQKYMVEHPEYIPAGVTMSHFSFQIPRPLQENYVRKRPRVPGSYDDGRPFDAGEARPLAWVSPEDSAKVELQLGMPSLSSSSLGRSSPNEFMPK